MSTQTAQYTATTLSEDGAAKPGSLLSYVARQPILDVRGRVHGYELLFRAGPQAFFSGDGDQATRAMLDNMLLFGLERLTAGLPAFVNCTAESLTEELVHVMPSGMTVLEILETLDPTPGLIAACRKMKSEGYRLALDDFVWKPELEPLVEIANYIKVDFKATSAKERRVLLQRLRNAPLVLIAEKVETQEEYKQAQEEGFTLFQGYYFCRPVLQENHKVPPNRLSHIEIMQLLHNDPFDKHKVVWAVKRDASLAYRLLRLANSPACAIRQQVRSIEVALMMVGDEMFRRIATLAIASELNAGQPSEILRMMFMRGRFCEMAAREYGMDSNEQYLLGMFSLLPAILRLPMDLLTSAMPLREEIRAALRGERNFENSLLRWLEGHERGDWAACDAVILRYGLDQEKLVQNYAEAVVWAESVLQFSH
jgi:EAL and modified HD-GYP domain-containing signal transduction protein